MPKHRVRPFIVCLGLAALYLTNVSCQRHQAEASRPQDSRDPSPAVREVNAAWYQVPADSLARRRAGAEELTAAHDQLPLGTRVRVTHLGNGKSVIVRITDRGIDDPKVEIDLSKEAAQKLEMVSEGIARVRLEVLPND